MQAAFWLGVAAPGIASAAVPGDLSVSGFGTLGVTHQFGGGELGFRRTSAQPGATSATSVLSDTRAGLQLDWNGNDRWNAGLQAVAVQRPPGTPLGESIHWAYLGYRPLPDTQIRIGRVRHDVFLFADSRDVGYALPWARPPVDFYGFISVQSMDGIDMAQRWDAGDSSWRARLTYGSFKTSVADLHGGRAPLRGPEALTLSLARQEGGLTLKGSYLQSRVLQESVDSQQQLQGLLDGLAALPAPGVAASLEPLRPNLWTRARVSYAVLATQYESGPWTLIAEGSQLKVSGSPLDARRGYLSAGYRRDATTYYAVASRVVPRKALPATPDVATPLAPVIGPQAAAQAQTIVGYVAAVGPLSRFDQSTIGFGLRWDFSPQAALKLQADRFDVHPNGAAAWRNADGRAAHGTLLTLLVDFVWGGP